MNYTVIKHDRHLRTQGRYTKHELQASVIYNFLACSQMSCNTQLMLLHLLYDIEVMWRKTIKHTFSMFYTLIKEDFSTNQSMCRVQSIF